MLGTADILIEADHLSEFISSYKIQDTESRFFLIYRKVRSILSENQYINYLTFIIKMLLILMKTKQNLS